MAKNSFVILTTSETAKNAFSRKFGTTKNTVDPLITGYHFTYWAKVPSFSLADYNPGGVVAGDIPNLLASLCLAVTLPPVTINQADFQGLGGIQWSVPTSITDDNNCSMRFLETSGTPILTIFHNWIRMIRNYKYGASDLTGTGTTDSYSKANYSATVLYWTTEPNGQQMEFSSCLTGLFPTKDPKDSFSHDLAAIDKLEIDIDFHVDRVYREPWVYNACKNYNENYRLSGITHTATGGDYIPVPTT